MNRFFSTKWFNPVFSALILGATTLTAQNGSPLHMDETVKVGQVPPIPVALTGFTGEAAEVLKFDLYVQGCCFVSPDAAKFVINGTDSGVVVGSVTDTVARKVAFSRSYNGASLRRQA